MFLKTFYNENDFCNWEDLANLINTIKIHKKKTLIGSRALPTGSNFRMHIEKSVHISEH